MNKDALARVAELQYFLLDMDGTIYMGPHAIPGAVDFVEALKATGKQFLFFTNNPTRDGAEYVAPVRPITIRSAFSDLAIFTSTSAMLPYFTSAVTSTPLVSMSFKSGLISACSARSSSSLRRLWRSASSSADRNE